MGGDLSVNDVIFVVVFVKFFENFVSIFGEGWVRVDG